MRGANQFLKNKTYQIEQHVKQSEHQSNQIGPIKQSRSPYMSNTNLSDGREKWLRYLPNQNHYSQHRFSSFKDQSKNDNYLQSLQRRLQKLFLEEKQMLRERHYKNGHINHEGEVRDQINANKYKGKQRGGQLSYNIDSMQRKIRLLEQKYRKQEWHNVQNQSEPVIRKSKDDYQKKTRVKQVQHKSDVKQRQKAKSQYSPTYSQKLLTQSVQQCVTKQKHLQQQVQLLKQSVKQIRQNNQQLLKIVHRKDQKKRHKYRTKQLLQNIIHKLQFINVEIKSAKKRELKLGASKMNKIQKEAGDLYQQFQLLRLQYKHLEQQRKKVQMKQQELQNKLTKITNQNHQSLQ